MISKLIQFVVRHNSIYRLFLGLSIIASLAIAIISRNFNAQITAGLCVFFAGVDMYLLNSLSRAQELRDSMIAEIRQEADDEDDFFESDFEDEEYDQ